MNKIKTTPYFLIIFSLFLILGCESEKQKQEDLAQIIAEESCQEIGQISSGIVGGVVSGLVNFMTGGNIGNVNTGSLGKIPDNWCDCYTYFVTKDLSENFSEKELMEIRNDKIKKILVIRKILETRQLDMKKCIEESTAEKIIDYNSFAKELDKKFRN